MSKSNDKGQTLAYFRGGAVSGFVILPTIYTGKQNAERLGSWSQALAKSEGLDVRGFTVSSDGAVVHSPGFLTSKPGPPGAGGQGVARHVTVDRHPAASRPQCLGRWPCFEMEKTGLQAPYVDKPW